MNTNKRGPTVVLRQCTLTTGCDQRFRWEWWIGVWRASTLCQLLATVLTPRLCSDGKRFFIKFIIEATLEFFLVFSGKFFSTRNHFSVSSKTMKEKKINESNAYFHSNCLPVHRSIATNIRSHCENVNFRLNLLK